MKRAEAIVAAILLVGGVLGVAIMAFGVIAGAVQAHTGLQAIMHVREPGAMRGPAPDAVSSMGQIVGGLRQRPVDPLAISALGIVVLFATPVAAVLVSGLAFLSDGDRTFAAIAGAIFAALLLSFLVGGGG